MLENSKCLDWGRKILVAEGLQEWKIEWKSEPHSEGYTWSDNKTISLSWPEEKPWPALMLHEITHAIALSNDLFDPNQPHDSFFAHIYMDLVTRWMKPVGDR